MKEVITSLECQLMEALSTIETVKADIKTLKEGAEVAGSLSFDRDKESKVEAPKLPMFKGVLTRKRWRISVEFGESLQVPKTEE